MAFTWHGKRETMGCNFSQKHENYFILTRLSLWKSYLIPAANALEISPYETSFFHFWQNTNFRLPFAVRRKRDAFKHHVYGERQTANGRRKFVFCQKWQSLYCLSFLSKQERH